MKIFAVIALALLFAACGRETPPAPTDQPAQQAQAPEAPPAETVEPRPEAPGSSDGESVDETTSTASPIATAIAANTPAPASGNLGRWKEGENFQVYPVAQPVTAPPGNVEVIEAFWYGCGHCYALEPRLEAWEKSKPAWIKVRRLPVIWNEVTREDARLYFTVESLGLVEKLHTEIYRQIHQKGKPLTVIQGGRVDRAATEKATRAFLATHGVSAQDFAKHYRSFSAENKLRQAENLMRRYLFDHTPMVAVHGKYLTDPEMAGGVDQLFQLVNDLAAREHGSP
jgi:thiol:disulfide interchange protein DsbA